MLSAFVSAKDAHQGIGQSVLSFEGDEDDPNREVRLPDKSLNQLQAPLLASGNMHPATPNPRRRARDFYSHNASPSTKSPTTFEPTYRVAPWRKNV